GLPGRECPSLYCSRGRRHQGHELEFFWRCVAHNRKGVIPLAYISDQRQRERRWSALPRPKLKPDTRTGLQSGSRSRTIDPVAIPGVSCRVVVELRSRIERVNSGTDGQIGAEHVRYGVIDPSTIQIELIGDQIKSVRQ